VAGGLRKLEVGVAEAWGLVTISGSLLLFLFMEKRIKFKIKGVLRWQRR